MRSAGFRPGRGRRVLVVDDESPMLNLNQAILEEAGFEVILALGGRAGIDAFRARRGAIDAVVLDLAMPEVGGDEVLSEIRSVCPRLPVVMVSGYREEVARGQLGEHGGTAFLAKPYDPDLLLESLLLALSGLSPP